MLLKLIVTLATLFEVSQGYIHPKTPWPNPPICSDTPMETTSAKPPPACIDPTTESPTEPPTLPACTDAPTNPPTNPPTPAACTDTPTNPPTNPPTPAACTDTSTEPPTKPSCTEPQTEPPTSPPSTVPPTDTTTLPPPTSDTTTPPPTDITTPPSTVTTTEPTPTDGPITPPWTTEEDISITSPSPFVCPEPYGKFPHEYTCHLYYYCVFDKPKLMRCAKGKYFSKYKGKCTKDPSQCNLGWRDIGCTEIGLFPVPNSCTEYYVCLENLNGTYKRTKQQCLSNQYFDSEVEECVPGDCPVDEEDEDVL